MKKYLLTILFAIILSINSAIAENIKFAQVTDVHLSKNNEYSKKVLESAVNDINNQDGISFVVFTGDNIDQAKEDDLRVFFKIVNKLNVPYYVVIGNHDVYKYGGLSKAKFMEIMKREKMLLYQRKPSYKFSKNGFDFYIVDGAKEMIPGASGYFRKDTVSWIDKQLTKNSKKTSIIFQHFPLVLPPNSGSHRYKSHRTYKGEEYLAVLEKHDNVLAVVSGHLHTNNETMQNGIYHISTSSLLTLPHTYKIIDIVTTKEFSPIIFTQLREITVKN